MNPALKSLILLASAVWAQPGAKDCSATEVADDCRKLQAALLDLRDTFSDRYPNAQHYLTRLTEIETALRSGNKAARQDLHLLRKEALLANPLVKELPGLLMVKRRPKDLDREVVFTASDLRIGHMRGLGREIGMPSNHECNASLEREGYDNEICVLSPVSPQGKLSTLYRPENNGYVGGIDLHFDGQRLLFTQSDKTNWKLWEIRADGTDLRQVS